MKIIIDTKEDSKEQIKRAAQFLISIADGTSTPEEFNADVSVGALGMFDDAQAATSSEKESPEDKKPFNINQLQEY